MSEPNNNLPFEDARAISGLMGLALGPDAAGPQNTSAASKFTTPAKEDLADKFPSLEILERIGSGGMGCVYKAKQKELDRIVALKILPDELGRDPKFAERFGREAKALARLQHPNIVALFEIGEVDGLHYLVMEYMDGMNLREFMNVEQAGGIDVVDVMSQICAAVQYAHDQGIVHRDIKPENVLFDVRGHVKIADFGLAKLEQLATQDITLTGSRQAMGTLHYMAPEQWNDPHNVDHRADVYALGVMLYELVTGRLPLGHFEPPSVLAGADSRVDEIVMKAMQSSLDSRYQSASQLATDLGSLKQVGSVQSVNPAAGGGTFTNFLNIGGRMQSIARRVVTHSDANDDAGFPWLTFVWAVSIFVLSFGDWVEQRDAFSSSVPYLPVDIPNSIPVGLAAGVFFVRLFNSKFQIRGELLTIVLCGLAIAQAVIIYAAHEMVYPRVRMEDAVRLTVLPGAVGALFAIMFLDTVWSLFVRFCGTAAVGAKAWGSWVSGLNQRVLKDMGLSKEQEEAKKLKAERIERENKEKWDRFYRRLKKLGVGPRKVWEAFGVEDDEPVASAKAESLTDDLYDEAVKLVVANGKASISMLQRELSIGYGRAIRLIDQLEAKGVIGPKDAAGSREVLIASP
jgi:serine/threonine protein kinase